MNANKLKIINLILLIGLVVSLFFNLFNKTQVMNATETEGRYGNAFSPSSELDVNLIKTMVNNYKSNQLRFVEGNLNKPDAQSIWFDLETLKSFIAQIEQNTQSNDASINTNQLGIRMYYASYPERENMATFEDLKDTPQEYEKMHTLVMIPTIKIENANVDYNPTDASTYTSGLKNVEKYGLSNEIDASKISAKTLATTSTNTDAQNHGVLYPPAFDGGTGF